MQPLLSVDGVHTINHCFMLAGVSEADSEIRNLLHAPSGSAAVPADRVASSSDEDTSDEAFASRHGALEAEEQQRFNSFAGKSVSLLITLLLLYILLIL